MLVEQCRVKVSVIVPVYNDEKYIEECMDSILSQSLRDIEVICINDGSTDNTLNILECYAEKDNRIRLFNQENHGRSYSRNKGINEANGEYLAFMDSDDKYPNNDSLKRLYEAAVKKGVDVVRGKAVSLNTDGVQKIIKHPRFIDDEEYFREGFHSTENDTVLCGWTAHLYKKDFIKKHNIKFRGKEFFEDPLFLTDVWANTNMFYHVDEFVYCVRVMVHGYELDYKIVCQILESLYLMVDIAQKSGNRNLVQSCYRAVCGDNGNTSYYSAICRLVSIGNKDVIELIKNINMEKDSCYNIENYMLDEKSIKQVVSSAIQYEQDFLETINGYSQILIYGAGINGKKMFNILNNFYNGNILGFAVSDQKKESKVLGMPCKSIANWNTELGGKRNVLCVVSVSRLYWEEIGKILNKYGLAGNFFDMGKWIIMHGDDLSVYPDKE